MELVQSQDTICIETQKVSTDHTENVVCKNTFFPPFSKQHGAARYVMSGILHAAKCTKDSTW